MWNTYVLVTICCHVQDSNSLNSYVKGHHQAGGSASKPTDTNAK
jgi:hypothetical protein